MNRSEYIAQLTAALRGKLAFDEIEDIVRDYQEFFDEGVRQGKSEEQVAAELGNPRDVAQQILSEERETPLRAQPPVKADSGTALPGARKRWQTAPISLPRKPMPLPGARWRSMNSAKPAVRRNGPAGLSGRQQPLFPGAPLSGSTAQAGSRSDCRSLCPGLPDLLSGWV